MIKRHSNKHISTPRLEARELPKQEWAPGTASALHPGKFRNILVPIDFSEQSLAALRYAVRLAEDSGAILELIYVLERPAFARDLECFPLAMSENELIGTAKQKLLAVADSEIEELVPVKTKVRLGNAAREIVAYAEESGADLIIMPTHGRTGFEHMLLGSTAETVVRLAGCPVLVFRPEKLAAHPPLVLDNAIADE